MQCQKCEVKDKQFAALLELAHGFMCDNPDKCKAPCKWTRFVAVALVELVPSAFTEDTPVPKSPSTGPDYRQCTGCYCTLNQCAEFQRNDPRAIACCQKCDHPERRVAPMP